MSHPLQLLLLLSLIIAAAKLSGAAATRLGQPAVFGEILVGLLLGPTVLNALSWPVFNNPVVPTPQTTLQAGDEVVALCRTEAEGAVRALLAG